MVSKIAVIALVAVIAVPIMAGYALNLDEETGYRYEESDQAVNVTPFLQNSVDYSYTNIDVYTLNSSNNFGNSGSYTMYPEYVTFSNSRSSVQLESFSTGVGTVPSIVPISGLTVYQAFFHYGSNDVNYNYPSAQITVGGVVYGTYSRVISIVYDYDHDWLLVTNLYSGNQTTTVISSPQYISYSVTGSWDGNVRVFYQTTTPTGKYVNIVDGFRLNANLVGASTPLYTQIYNSMDVKSELLTFNLNSITESNLLFSIGGSGSIIAPSQYWLEFEKTTTNGVVSWVARTCHREYNGPITTIDTIDLYYDPSNTNTYQVLMGYYGGEIRYVGNWPTSIGPSNVYLTYPFTLRSGSFDDDPQFIGNLMIYGKTPVMRIDGALARAFVSNIIENATYSPGSFKENPSTTITDLKVVGSSLTFGGHTYAATKDGYITLNGHKVPINKLAFNSVPGENGTYDNRIGDDVISNTPEPATLTFNGRWGANVKTVSQAETTYTETKWIAGDFAFNGIDSQFLMVGLITCVGAFIALGIYGRRSGTKVLPLMLVCAGAGILFLLMI